MREPRSDAVLMAEVIFSTVHGSHLYGMAGPHSDVDSFTVTTSTARARQNKVGDADTTFIGWDTFLEYCFTGSHQSLEALFSPYKMWNPEYLYYLPMLDGMRAGGSAVLSKYGRTVTKFAHAQDFKRRRHACRLWLNMQRLRQDGRFNPVMTPEEILWATELATSDTTGDELALLLWEGSSALSEGFLEEPQLDTRTTYVV